jgi:hypothetical protein
MHKFEDLAEVVSERILSRAVEVSRRLTTAGVPHALIGGLAVGLYASPRHTKDVDFLVGAEAFGKMKPLLVYREELADLVAIGFVDLLALPDGHLHMVEDLRVPQAGEIPVVSAEALVLLKLLAWRPQDRADIAALIRAGVDPDSVISYLQDRAPEYVVRFVELVG